LVLPLTMKPNQILSATRWNTTALASRNASRGMLAAWTSTTHCRTIKTEATPPEPQIENPPSTSTSSDTQTEPLTHYRITLRRSAIGLPKQYRATLESLGIHRRMQTVYHPHRPEFAGKILRVKELVTVENVPASQVRTKTEQRRERRPPKGYVVVERGGVPVVPS
jgi:large subunit ribosomal protein L30